MFDSNSDSELLTATDALSAAEEGSEAWKHATGNRSTVDATVVDGGRFRRPLPPPMPSSLSELDRPLTYGPYAVLETLASGGMGTVYKARHGHMRRLVALKVVLPQGSSASRTIRRFQREVIISGRLSHPHLVTAFDSGEEGDAHYLAMEYISGTDLYRRVRASGPLPVQQALRCAVQAARGLAYLHRQNIVHRDVKPPNLILDRDGTLKIIDLGLARFCDEPDDEDHVQQIVTRPGDVLGTVDFLAPEQAVNAPGVDARADLYSLGCTLFYLLTGLTPYRSYSPMQTIEAHRTRPIPRLSEYLERVPSGLQPIFERMLAKDPQDRYRHAAELADELGRLLSTPREKARRRSRPTRATRSAAPAPTAEPSRRRTKPSKPVRPGTRRAIRIAIWTVLATAVTASVLAGQGVASSAMRGELIVAGALATLFALSGGCRQSAGAGRPAFSLIQAAGLTGAFLAMLWGIAQPANGVWLAREANPILAALAGDVVDETVLLGACGAVAGSCFGVLWTALFKRG